MPALLVLFMAGVLSVPAAGRASTVGRGSVKSSTSPYGYREFQLRAAAHRKDLELEGMSYMVGGGVGLVTSLTLGISSKDVLPKIGYGLIQTLSAGAISYGAVIYFTGDNLNREAGQLTDLAGYLTASGISPAQKQKILDDATYAAIYRAAERAQRVKRIRGVLELVTAASAGATLAFSSVGGTASNLSLGFIMLAATAGGVSDLWSSRGALKLDDEHVFDVGLNVDPRAPGLNLAFRW